MNMNDWAKNYIEIIAKSVVKLLIGVKTNNVFRKRY